jgi:cellulose synthase/poly-beta-1,6-N-acetylglucosamine synthase-like glycosyltransferase
MELVLIVWYTLLLTLLFVYGLNIFYLTFLARKHSQPDHVPPPLERLPTVTVQLPVYNERYVARRVIEAAAQLDWPQDRLQIQVLDDSTDDTTAIISTVVQQFQQRGVNIQHICRPHREGFKAGALAEGLHSADGEFVAIFDADFLPASDFLHKTIPHFYDSKVAFVQTRWAHLNADYGLLTRLQSIAIDAHFAVEQFARNRAGFLMNFNGTGGVWRRSDIDLAGGWQADTLTEDLDLSYRVQFAGKRAVYLRDIEVPGEIPHTLNAFRRQQHRWARGSIECARKLLPRLLRSNYSPLVKLQGLLHLTGYGIQLLMSLVVLSYPVLLATVETGGVYRPLYALTGVFTLTFFAPTVYLITGQQALGKNWQAKFQDIVLLSLLGVGMMYHNAAAVLQGLFSRRKATFDRTPKYGILDASESTPQAKAYMLTLSPIVAFELVMVLVNGLTVYMALRQQNWTIAFFAAFFMIGLLFVLMLNIAQEIQQWRASFLRQEHRRTHPTR